LSEVNPPNERGGFFSGKRILLLTLSLVIIVPAVTFLAYELASRDLAGADRPLDWDNRRQWTGLDTTPVTFRRGMMSSARSGKTFEDFGFHLDAETKKTVQRCAALARKARDGFASDDVRRRLEAHQNDQPELFYPRYLLGTWHRVNGNADKARAHYRAAFERAGAAIVTPYVDPSGKPATNTAVGTRAVAIDQVINDKLVQDVQLIYPHLQTDEAGRVYLPVFGDTPYRFADPDNPAATQPGTVRGWFTFPGRVGRVEPVTYSEPAGPSPATTPDTQSAGPEP
jgi:hypothetical protein